MRGLDGAGVAAFPLLSLSRFAYLDKFKGLVQTLCAMHLAMPESDWSCKASSNDTGQEVVSHLSAAIQPVVSRHIHSNKAMRKYT